MAEAATLAAPPTDTPTTKAAAAGAAPPAPPETAKKPEINPVWRPLAKPSPEAEKRQDDALAKILGNDDEEASGEAGGEADDGEAEADADEAEGETDAEPADKADGAPADDEDRAKAIQALRRDGYTTDEINELAKNPERLTALGTRAAKRQAESDRLSTELGRLKEQIAKDTGKADTGETEPAALDLSTAAEPLAKLLSEDAGIEDKQTREALGAFSTALGQEVLNHVAKQFKPQAEQIQQFGEAIEAIGGLLQGLLVRESRQSLLQKTDKDGRRPYAALEDEATFGRVTEAMKRLDGRSYNGDLTAWMSDAALLTFGHETRAEEQARKARLAKHKANGTPETGAAPTRSATTDIPSRFRHMDLDELGLALVEEQNAGKISRDERLAIFARAKAGRNGTAG